MIELLREIRRYLLWCFIPMVALASAHWSYQDPAGVGTGLLVFTNLLWFVAHRYQRRFYVREIERLASLRNQLEERLLVKRLRNRKQT